MKFRIITPTHIGTGNDYYIINGKDGYLYSLEYAISLMDKKKITDKYLINNLMNCKKNSAMSKQDFINMFNFNYNCFDHNFSICKANNNIEQGNTYECVKDTKGLYIPGSTIKGYIENLIFYDIIKNNKEIRSNISNMIKEINNKYKNNFEISFKNKDNKLYKEVVKKIKRETQYIQNNFQKIVKDLFSQFGVRDIYFTEQTSIYSISRFSNKNTVIPLGNFETLSINDESVSFPLFKTLNYIKKYEFNSNFDNLIYKSVENIILDINNWFINANRNFMNEVLNEELKFAKNRGNESVNFDELIKKLNYLIQINNNSILIQIGKETNFILKSFNKSFTEIYDECFRTVFSPLFMDIKKAKVSQGISMMPLIIENNKGLLPLGFVEIIK